MTLNPHQSQSPNLNWTLIIVDASFCPKSHACGYGYNISSTNGKEEGGDVLDFDPEDSLNAEMAGMLRALQIAVRKGIYDHNIILSCDCVTAWDYLCGYRTAHPNTQRQEIVFEYLNTIRMHRLSVTFKHVKGHTEQDVNDPRNAANRKCDEVAKFYMRIRRQDIGHTYYAKPKKPNKKHLKRQRRRAKR